MQLCTPPSLSCGAYLETPNKGPLGRSIVPVRLASSEARPRKTRSEARMAQARAGDRRLHGRLRCGSGQGKAALDLVDVAGVDRAIDLLRREITRAALDLHGGSCAPGSWGQLRHPRAGGLRGAQRPDEAHGVHLLLGVVSEHRGALLDQRSRLEASYERSSQGHAEDRPHDGQRRDDLLARLARRVRRFVGWAAGGRLSALVSGRLITWGAGSGRLSARASGG